MGKMSLDDIKKRIQDLVKDEYVLIDEKNYKNTMTKTRIRHNKCGREYDVKMNSFFQRRRCSKCVILPGRIPVSLIEIKDRLYRQVGNEYELVNEKSYEDTQTKTMIRHNTCGYEYSVIMNNFFHGNRCPKCSTFSGSIKRTQDIQIIKDRLYRQVGNEYELVNEKSYKNTQTKTVIRHNTCGYEYNTKLNDFFDGARCPKCNLSKRTQDIQTIKKRIYKEVKDEYELINEESYKNTHTKTMIRHNICGYEYNVTLSDFFHNDSRCPKCNLSKGEKSIENFLFSKDIPFISQYKIKECRNKYSLQFDFAILRDNNKPILIEYDGKQHYEVISFSKDSNSNLKNFEETKLRDQIKDRYCRENNISLIRIKYNQNIETCMKRVLQLLKKE